jgi:hypothetical protein
MKVEERAVTTNTAGRPRFYKSTPDTDNVVVASEDAQTTTTGYEIPVPARGDFEDLLDRAATKRPPEQPS